MQDFINRLKKNVLELRRWAARRSVMAYRVYDRDIPGYPYVVELLGDWAVVASFARDPELDAGVVAGMGAIAEVLGVPVERLIWRKRERQRGSAQYQRISESPLTSFVVENGLRFELNLSQYLDCGLFLDHRKTRALLRDLAAGRRCLNLFCYTGTASVAMASGGARHVTSVDMSRTYLQWANTNFANNVSGDHAAADFLQMDVVGWLAQPWRGERWDLIFVDPPSFSNSKRMDGTFDVQRDHAWMLDRLADRLSPQGLIVFTNNRSGFVLDDGVLAGFHGTDMTTLTHPRDFRGRKAHRSYAFSRDAAAVAEAVRCLRALGPDA